MPLLRHGKTDAVCLPILRLQIYRDIRAWHTAGGGNGEETFPDGKGFADGCWHNRILKAFSEQRADILVGTQMIVKGHDFPNVTLVGVLAADLSLNADNYRASERTFQLLAQAAGRAGRGEKAGDVVFQTYQPEHYSVANAACENYQGFYRQELAVRQMLHYPPISNILEGKNRGL